MLVQAAVYGPLDSSSQYVSIAYDWDTSRMVVD